MTNSQFVRKVWDIVSNAGVFKSVLVILLAFGVWFSYDWYREKSDGFDATVNLRERLVHDHIFPISLSICRKYTDSQYYKECEQQAEFDAGIQASISSSDLTFYQYILGKSSAYPPDMEGFKERFRIYKENLSNP